ncbi:MAG: hypothetical protein HRU07_05395 [Nitrosopumilus sp.]|nr:hypothetical protein [Nitrosopumilus sp.]NRA05581.1 hypothetical protein [Nitrosopumilus sp.]
MKLGHGQKVSVLGLGVFSILLVLFFSLGFESESGVSLGELEQNQYSVTPEIIPITVTTSTISPLTEKVSSDTQSVTPKIIEQNNYLGSGFVFPFLQKSFGIVSTDTTLNYDEWSMGGDFDSVPIRMDESGGIYDGMLYIGTFAQPIIHRFDPTTEELTPWTIPLGSYTGVLLKWMMQEKYILFHTTLQVLLMHFLES